MTTLAPPAPAIEWTAEQEAALRRLAGAADGEELQVIVCTQAQLADTVFSSRSARQRRQQEREQRRQALARTLVAARLRRLREYQAQLRQHLAECERALAETEALPVAAVGYPVIPHKPAPPAREKRRARPQDTSQVLTVQEAAARLRMDRNEVYTHIRTGKLVSLQQTPGGKHRIPVWALKQFLKEEINGEARQR